MPIIWIPTGTCPKTTSDVAATTQFRAKVAPPLTSDRPEPVEVLMSAKHGRCQCGAVQFSVDGPLRDVVYCHCKMCRRSIGHVLAATACALPHLRVDGADSLQWYQSSASARRGFCRVCGSNLFWVPASGTHVSI